MDARRCVCRCIHRLIEEGKREGNTEFIFGAQQGGGNE